MRIDIIVILIHLLVIAVIDYKHHIISDQLVMFLLSEQHPGAESPISAYD